MDPRIELYSDVLSRYEFSLWGDLEVNLKKFKKVLEGLTKADWDIPHIRTMKRTCILCVQSLQNHCCVVKICENCDGKNRKTGECGDIACYLFRIPKSQLQIERYLIKCETENLPLIRCYRCRKTGHLIC